MYLTTLEDKQEGRTDYFYTIAWNGNASDQFITIELHHWQASPPKVHAEAFLQFYEKKLARFTESPDSPPSQFFIIAKCLPSCFESETVPEAAFKATLKMGNMPSELNISKAYFQKDGELYKQLKTKSNGAAFGTAIPMTATLQWNKDVPEKPFIELIKIDSFDWHP